MGKHRKEGEDCAREMKERAGDERMEGKQRGKKVNVGKQTAGERKREREKSPWRIVARGVVVSLEYRGNSRLPSSDVTMELDGSETL